MSWKDRLQNVKFSIRTGDGKTYEPLWKSSEKEKPFNVAKYDFINQSGSFIDRKQPQGNLYPLVFYFQGEDNIDQTDAFEDSAIDNRLWTIEHPFYGTIKGQPVNIKRNDNSYNVTEVTVDFWESIDGAFPDNEISINDEVISKVNLVNASGINFAVENSSPQTSDINLVKDGVILTASKFSPDADSFNDFQNLLDKAVKSSDKLVTDTRTAFVDVQNVVNAPALFATNVKSKVNSYIRAYELLKDGIGNLFSKYNFESQGASVISGICLSCINPQENDYVTRSDIEEVNTLLTSTYADYLETLDNNQITIYDLENNFTPTIQIQSNLIDLVSFTSRSLFLLSFNARQERTIELKKDSNLILLTHRFLGLDAEDNNLDTFRKINNIKNGELFKIRQGRTIKYFV
jgi:hypothetical protein